MRILVIEDEKKIASFIKSGLEEERYIVETVHDGETGYELALNNHFDAILLDVMLPGKNGIDVLKDLRKANISTPVIMLTALGTTEDKIAGLDTGADDYLPKPFSFQELTARLRAVLRRSSIEKTTRLSCGDLILDTVSHIAIKGEMEIELTTKEYALLEYLMRNKNRILSRSNITQHVWKHTFDPESNIIDVYIKRLRTKIDGSNEKPSLQSIRGVGYRLRDTQS
jgi:DNA-binding response OmpR family regulator